MAAHLLHEGLRTRSLRKTTILQVSRTTDERAFSDTFKEIQAQSGGGIRYHSFITKPTTSDDAGIDFSGSGYITANVLRQVLAIDDYDFYLCGPPAFMQVVYDDIRSLGVIDERIFAEEFGPAALTRRLDIDVVLPPLDTEAEEAIIKFSKAGFEQRWTAGDATLLEVAEQHGLSPSFGCRTGACGSCAVKLVSGDVTYRTKPKVIPAVGEILICCAVPKKESHEKEGINLSSIIEIDL
jgi:Na+-transporting NADH:ubiquinone oxidoreductase subunit NqrF